MNTPGMLTENPPMRRLGARYLSWTAYGLWLLAVFLLQMTPRLLPAIGGVRPLPLIPLVVCVAMFVGPVGGGAIGVATGLLWDLFSDRLFGFTALLLLVIGCACGLLVRLLIRNNLLSAMLLMTVVVLIHGLTDWFLCYALWGNEEPLWVLLRLTLPAELYTLLISPLIYGATLGIARVLKTRE